MAGISASCSSSRAKGVLHGWMWSLIGFPGIILCVVPGCSQSEFRYVPVSGIVTVDGKPAVRVQVNFKPVPQEGAINSGAASQGWTDDEGRYTLNTLTHGGPRGAVVGVHRVTILGLESARNLFDFGTPDDPMKVPKEKLPTVKIPKSVKLPINFTVPEGGTNQANFSL
ncbi:hypothetical protein V22_40600 [Calycomorphotria hydatis]|uniref:Carboxypeptidase regulatory-like domain-containing protein n=1 Tax=Calycomorphotria hydatis TaxID=2528027 RepID=A0A517TEJ3_9PLAN|nr:hypothetical protein V22_40600 [Calycomorphotria hydatis]